MKSSDSNYLSAIIQRCIRRESGGSRRVFRSRCENPRRDSLLRCWLTKFLRQVSASGIPDGPSGEDRRAGKGGRDSEGLRFSSGGSQRRVASFPQARQGPAGWAKGNAKGRAQYRITTHNNGGKISGVCFAVGYITDYHATVQRARDVRCLLPVCCPFPVIDDALSYMRLTGAPIAGIVRL